MNYNRRRNIFTLGDFHQHPNPIQQIKAQQYRRQNSDPFERDPFKIQSYNFRYADRPSHPLVNLVNRANNHTQSQSGKRFETFFYNYDFAPSVHDKENPPANKFREFRRRKFLLDNQQQNPQSLLQQMRTSVNATHSTAGGHSSYIHNADANYSGFSAAAAHNTAATSSYHQPQQQSNDYNQRQRNQRHYLTETSSVCTSSGGPSTSGNTTKGGSGSPLQRSTVNREHLRSTVASTRLPQQALIGRFRSSSSRSSLAVARALERSRRARNDSLAAGNSCSYFAPLPAANSTEQRASSVERTTTADHPRQPLQTIHPSTQNMVTATVEQAQGTRSGCQININIKGLDAQQLGENVVIKIEADNKSVAAGNASQHNVHGEQQRAAQNVSALNNIYNGVGACNDIAIAKIVEVKRTSEMNANMDVRNNFATMLPLKQHRQQQQLQLQQQQQQQLQQQQQQQQHDSHNQNVENSSSSTFIIDKRLSKFAMRNEERDHRRLRDVLRSSSHSRVPPQRTLSPVHRISTTALRAASSTEALYPMQRSISKERMPSLVPWRLDTKQPRSSGFGVENDTEGAPQSGNFMRRSRPNYTTTLNDIRNIRRKQTSAAYAPAMPLRGNHGLGINAGLMIGGNSGTTGPQGKGQHMSASTKAGDSIKNPAAGGQAAQRRVSRLSLRTLTRSKSTILSQSSSHLDLKRSPAMIIQSRTSMKQPGIVQSRQSLKTMPLNVNINVFADKLKLLRV